MQEDQTREKIITWLNDMLDVDHDLIRSVMTSEYDISPESILRDSPLAYESRGVKVMTAIDLISAALEKPIQAKFEGELIKEFE